ncbi:GIY-YIG nuclease family protein [Aphanothece sacrum]|uniref:Nuclease subunit of the excinuclease complex n=1 Tax=Aphanothece sacrum FPU1 TaxID=1920663 RepID=A0A401IG74_APHSA|nr:GIY-YIG nuclease family protein [Aphanothece sacrum]GBF80211.1 hypothetical protein AsFPU1_1612 [Aphanothece sacrum FPU1]GBF85364.1 hypothetical protein AsFPU3_2423 [Aphanothece sacrum FPU3]
MTTETEILQLTNLEYISYLDNNGLLPEELQNQIGVYAIFNQEKELQFVGYSRDIYLSLKQHLVRKPDNCYWIKIQTITRPSRTILEEIKQAWITENGVNLFASESEEKSWTDPIDAKIFITEDEKQTYNNGDELSKMKLLKSLARRIETEIKQTLENRGSQLEIRFNPKLKEQGLLDLK